MVPEAELLERHGVVSAGLLVGRAVLELSVRILLTFVQRQLVTVGGLLNFADTILYHSDVVVSLRELGSEEFYTLIRSIVLGHGCLEIL